MDIIDISRNSASPSGEKRVFETLLAESWGRLWPDELQSRLVQWRYYNEARNRTTLVAMMKGRGVAMIDSIARGYLLHGSPIQVRETGDWYCDSNYRKYAIGLHLMRKLMRESPEPMLVIGGSKANRAILAKIWQVLPPVYSYVLPVKARGVLGNVLRLVAPAHEACAKALGPLPLRPPRHPVMPPGRYHTEPLTEWVALPHDDAPELVGCLAEPHYRQLVGMPAELGQVFGTLFYRDDELVGGTLAQIEPTPSGNDGKILRIRTGNRPDPALLQWMVAVTSLKLTERGAGFIRCRASTPAKVAALRATGYRFSQEFPCFWFDPCRRGPPATIDLDYMRGDDAQPMQALIGLHMNRRRRWFGLAGPSGESRADLGKAA